MALRVRYANEHLSIKLISDKEAELIRFVKLMALATTIVMVTTMSVSAAEIHVMSGGAPKEVFALLAPRFEEQTDSKVEFTYAVITELREKLSAGATADVLVLPTAVLELNGAGSHHLRAHAPYAHSIRPPIQC